MKTKKPVLKPLILAASVLFCCALRLPAQTAPAITTQPTNQTNLAGANATFSVAVSGPGPFSYQWQFNGTNLPNNIISTVAGGGPGGDGGPAANASLSRPFGVASDNVGNLYVGDAGDHRIRKVDTNGIMGTVAGGGSAGDGGPAINASLSSSLGVNYGVAVDGAGNLYIADTASQRVRKVDTNGIITTVAGNGSGTYAGDGAAATNASLYGPLGVAVDAAGELYIADTQNNRIRKVDTSGVITTVAGKQGASYAGDGGAATNAKLSGPFGVALDAAGDLFIADSGNGRIRQVDTNGIITTVAGGGSGGDGGTATNASLNYPTGVALDALGNLYIAEINNNRIRMVDTNGIITTVAGNGSAAYAGDGGPPTNASLNLPSGVAVDAAGNLYIADYNNNRVRKVVPPEPPTLALPYVSASNAGSYAVVITNLYGSVTSAVATLTVQAPPVITVPPASQVAVAGSSPMFSVTVAGSGPYGYVWYFENTNLLQSGASSTLTLAGVSTNDPGNYTVVVTNAYGSVTSQIATLALVVPPSGNTQPGLQTVLAGTNVAFSVTADGPGPFSYQWQLNGANLPNNIITTVAGNGVQVYSNTYPVPGGGTYSGDGGAATNAGLNNPRGLAFDAAGNLFIADQNNNLIRKVDTNGIITTVAGNGTGGYSGDGGPATNASLYIPTSLAFDAAGNMFIADLYNGRVRKVDTSGVITTVATPDSPVGVALDGSGNIFILDLPRTVIELRTNGYISTVVSVNSAFAWLQGLAFDASRNLYMADENNHIFELNNLFTTQTTAVDKSGAGGYSGDGGLATSAKLYAPCGVAFDAAGNLYIADAGNNRIRKVATNGIISTVAGSGSTNYSGDGGAATNAGLFDPECLAFDATGNLYIADYNEQRVREVHLAGFPTLALTNASATNAGSYTVVVTSPYGSVTSAVAALAVTIPQTPPQIIACDASFGFVASQFGFNLGGAFGQTIVVDGSSDLVNWTPLCTNTVGGSAVYFCDPCWTNFGWRFYRARLP